MIRSLKYEALEARYALTASNFLSDYIDLGDLEIETTYTTLDAPTNHVTSPGTQWDGVSS